MAAAQAVFETYELVKNIISRLTNAKEVTRAMAVCKTWNHIIERSPLLQECRVLMPSLKARKYYNKRWKKWAGHVGYDDVDIVHWRFANPGDNWYIREEDRYGLTEAKCFDCRFSFVLKYETEGSWELDDFVTFPPVQAIDITAYSLQDRLSCTAYVKRGVKLEHLIDCSRAMVRSDGGDADGADDWQFEAHFTLRSVQD